jgi:hypothetical protein
VEHRVSTKSFQALRSPAFPLTSFHDLPVFLISSSIVLRHILFGLPLLQYPWGGFLYCSCFFTYCVSNPVPFSSFYPNFYWLLFGDSP